MTFTKSGIAYVALEELWLSGSYESQWVMAGSEVIHSNQNVVFVFWLCRVFLLPSVITAIPTHMLVCQTLTNLHDSCSSQSVDLIQIEHLC